MASPPGTKKRHGPTLASKKDQFLDLIESGMAIKDARYQLGMTNNHTFESMRRNDLEWDARIKAVTTIVTGKGKYSINRAVFNPDRKLPPKGTYAQFVRKYYGRSVPSYLQHLADVCLTPSNRRVIALMPPGAGKDTTLGQIVAYEKCDDKDYLRITWMMENEKMALKRVSERIEPYFTDTHVYDVKPPGDPEATVPESTLIADYGPFKFESGMKYPDGSPVRRTTWSKKEGYRFLQSSRAPEADPDLQVTGQDGEIQGTRINRLIASDLFTQKNQKNPELRDAQMANIKGTFEQRLDGSGRFWFINTRVGYDDNCKAVMEWLVPDGVEIYEQFNDGPVTITRYTNGSVILICQAIWADEDGREHSFDPDRFPLEDYWVTDTGDKIPFEEVERKTAERNGWALGTGLLSQRAADSELFETMYQQNPTVDSAGVDFTPDILDMCDNPHRSYGQAFPHEELHLIIDPARRGGAAFAVLAVDYDRQHITVVDEGWRKDLGVNGIKNYLILGPARQWHPAEVVYEGNHEQSVMFDTEIQSALKAIGANPRIIRTGEKRNDRVAGIFSVQREMRKGMISFPTAMAGDRKRTSRIKRHFLNWEGVPMSQRRSGSHQALAKPDDLCMAIATGIINIRSLIERHTPEGTGRRTRKPPPRPVPASIARRWEQREQAPRNRRDARYRRDRYTDVNIDALVMGEWEG